ncbi:Hypothetical protein LBF_2158 [Leptospira biflexa serovar Patoc strain 'Patoc 1 (Ames)']|uniref:Uncharacterized protein n=1 Tax=Leptospira biflexa serovar Patoc (strain Patoc 1 / ATCC 23582 / Paris) TaxID=456481 RepID=B0ST78_LEPBP|nr:hypothetical protein [Leptospira biflexa]ABZ94655.1 Hypothetical protein LBF_2158 [Leptospira biflexa serovar Patoc strain 'Patoc 1 (Ames)']ABZ98318.1 Hypothetical protein LEPBI_I2220 [Leptospira biflexa serovar Patoc strain 'Patoc 1 (Paris)']
MENLKKFLKQHEILSAFMQVFLFAFEVILNFYSSFYFFLRNVIILVLIALATYISLDNDPYLKGFTDKVTLPEPEIVSVRCDDHSSNLSNLEYSTRVITSIRNLGGEGNVVVESIVQQGNQMWPKSELLFLSPQQTKETQIAFDETSIFGERIKCSSRTYSYSK